MKLKIIISLALLILAFAFGRYSVKQTTAVVTKEVEKEKQQDKHKVTVITKKNGEETTTITEDTKTHTDTNSLDIVKEITQGKSSMINISGLAGMDINSKQPVYGLSASKEFLGPVTLGAFFLTNKTVGVSIGVNF